MPLRRAARATRLLPALLAIAGGLGAIVVSIVAGAAAGALLADWLPVDPTSIDPLEAVSGAIGLIAIGAGLARRKRLAWWIAIFVFLAAAIDQGVLDHPVAVGLAVGCLAVLAADRRRYRVATDRRAVRPALAIATVVVAAAVLEAALSDVAAPLWAALPDRVATAVESLADTVALTGPDVPVPAGVPAAVLNGLPDAIDVAARLSLVVVALLVLRAVPGAPESDDELRHARSVARRYAIGALRPFQIGDDKRVYGLAGREAAIVHGEAGRFLVILGDPIGPPDDAAAALRAFTEAAELGDKRPAAYQVSEPWRAPFARLGFRLVRVGGEAIVDLDGFALAGSARANVRHTVTRARRGGVRVEWCPDGIASAAVRAQLGAIDADWRAARRGPELGFTIHAFDVTLPTATAVAFEADGTPSAFATFQPTGPGIWVLDLMRRRRGTPGALESCIAEAAANLAANGGRELSLGLAPLATLRPDGPLAERMLLLGGRLARPVYDVDGLAFFKSKFAPRWEPRYVAVRSRMDLVGLVVALLRLHVAGSGASIGRLVVSLTR